MKPRDLADLAVRNLREAILRNSLTTLGVAVGVASLVAMLSLGVGLQALASQRLAKSGLFDAVFVTSRRDFRGPGDGPPRKNPAPHGNPKPLDEDARQQFAKLPNVVDVYPQIRFFTDIRYNGNSYSTNVLGVPESRTASAFEGLTGKYFSSPTADEAILQTEFAKELSPQTASLIGQELVLRYAQRRTASPDEISKEQDIDKQLDEMMSGGISIVSREKKLRIAGIVDSDPSAGIGGFGGGRVFLPLRIAEQLHAAQPNDVQDFVRGGGSGKPTYAALTVRVKSPKEVTQVEDAIKSQGFSTFSLLDASKSLRLIFTVFDLFLGLFGSLALTVASLGIINTLVMAILERRREIGVLKALGATDGDVRSLFFAEAGAMGFVGGILGVTLGWLIGQALTWGTTIYLRRQDLPGVKISYVPWWLALSAIAFAVAVSLIAGLYPAGRAAKLNPVEALRYE
ncbi:MAG TPA: ABC transporter permease [Candidatus Acidoferrum sp.]|nr:ABC transporter permease [Candidatus Acidoferrum sp.]